MIITGAMTGSILVLGMGFRRALAAMVVGNLIMFGYVGLLGLLRRAVWHELRADREPRVWNEGFVVASGLLSTLLLGWYAVQTATRRSGQQPPMT